MKNKDIHKGLEKADIRDFLSNQIGVGYDGEVERALRQLRDAEESLEKAKKSQAARDLIRMNGWDYFDISDDIEDYDPDKYFHFVGTGEELTSKI